VYYVIPQVWAWHRSRVQILRDAVARSLVIFPFEEKLLKEEGAEAKHVGHPLLDVMKITMSREEALQKFQLDPSRKVIGLLPGSRRREVELLLPEMLGAAEKILQSIPDAQFVLPLASTIQPELVQAQLARHPRVQVKIAESMRYNIRAAMDFAIVASGTATLETGLLLCPMVVVYRVPFVSALWIRSVIKIPHVGLINIVAGERVVPELLQQNCTAKTIAEASLKILTSPAESRRIKARLSEIKDSMGGPGASQRAAESVLDAYARSRAAGLPAAAAGVGA
jgi:lipid-A-disaccharide synthase